MHVYLNARLSQCTSISRGAGHSVGACEGSYTRLNIEHSILQFKIILSYSRIIGLNAILILLCSKLLKKKKKSAKFNEYLSLFNSQYA